MATRSTISVLQPNGLIHSIYCHWDGYIEGVGKTLKEHYNTFEKANELIALGSLSSLHEMLSTNYEHSFENPKENVTIAYHRDRDEELCINTVINENEISFEEFNYLFKDNTWFVSLDEKMNFQKFDL